jgi:hypothetical protein
MSVHTEPKNTWTRSAAFLALFQGLIFPFCEPNAELVKVVLGFDFLVILAWIIGSNGRAAIVDTVRAWATRGANEDRK